VLVALSAAHTLQVTVVWFPMALAALLHALVLHCLVKDREQAGAHAHSVHFYQRWTFVYDHWRGQFAFDAA